MVFDDPLAITRAHVLSVPTQVYCPDIRSLFSDPPNALVLLNKMEQAAWTALEQGPLASEAWRRQALSPAGNALPIAELRQHVLMAFNLPPSQYQLHLQYMLLPLLPSHLGVYRKGGHFLKLRHFPLAYVLAALKALVEIGESFDATKMMPKELVARISKLGVDYDQAHAKDMERLEKSNALLANFDPADFSYGISSGVVVHKTTGAKLEGVSAKDLDGADKAALQGYGRPYVDGKPGGVYYRYPRPPQPLPLLGSSSACCGSVPAGCTAA